MSEATSYLVRRTLSILLTVAVCAAILNFAARPASALPSSQGYGWLVRASNGGVTSYNSSGQAVVLKQVATGRWDVAFNGQPQNPYGTPMVSAGNDTPGAICSLEQFSLVDLATTADTHLEISCTNRTGTLTNTGFTVSWTTLAGAYEGWLETNAPIPTDQQSYYSWIGRSVYISRYSVGYYQQYFSDFVIPGTGSNPGGVVMAAAVDPQHTGKHCTVLGWWPANNPPATASGLVCHNPAGALVDSRLVEHLVYNRGLFADLGALQGYVSTMDTQLLPPHWTTVTAPRSYNSKGGSTQILRFAPGVYVVRFDNLAGSKRMVNITVSDEGSANDKRCGAEASTADGAAQVVVKCVDGKTGQASDTSFGIAYSARP